MNTNDKNEIDELQSEIDRLKKYEQDYFEITSSSSYKWVKLFEREFIKGGFGKKIKFVFKLIGTGLKYYLITPLKNVFCRKEVKTTTKTTIREKTFPDLKVACILDTFSDTMFDGECYLYRLTPSNWKTVFSKNEIDFLLVESVWSGYKGSWLGFRNKSSNKNYELFKILDHCKNNDIKTVFWNKEDPVYFSSYIEYAKHFDFIFTSESSTIARYKQITGKNTVFPLMFSINPDIHNPIDKPSKSTKDIVFAGTYYTEHDDRKKDFEIVVKPATKYNLDIYSRHEQTKNTTEYRFPEEYQKFIHNPLPYNEMIQRYKE